MSALGTLRDRLNEIHDMMPLTERERRLARWVLWGDGEACIMEQIEASPAWWGEKAVETAKILDGD
jgi:hypothetical protein